jgi:hypothetical protein
MRYAPKVAIIPPERVKMPIAPTFCLRSVFCTPAKTAPAVVNFSVVLAVLARVSCGWKWSSAMAGTMGVGSVGGGGCLPDVDD